MNKPSRLTGRNALTPTPDINEALRRVVAGHSGPRRLIAAGIKRGTGQLVVKAVA